MQKLQRFTNQNQFSIWPLIVGFAVLRISDLKGASNGDGWGLKARSSPSRNAKAPALHQPKSVFHLASDCGLRGSQDFKERHESRVVGGFKPGGAQGNVCRPWCDRADVNV